MDAQSTDLISSLLPLVALFAIFYFLIIRPQQKQAKNHKEMVNNLKKGDKIVTNGGLMVEIIKVEDDYFVVKNNDGSELKLIREFVAKLLDENE
jgi:preprotein translocase subunit YajC